MKKIKQAIESKKSSQLVKVKMVPAMTPGSPHLVKQPRLGRISSPETVPFMGRKNGPPTPQIGMVS